MHQAVYFVVSMQSLSANWWCDGASLFNYIFLTFYILIYKYAYNGLLNEIGDGTSDSELNTACQSGQFLDKKGTWLKDTRIGCCKNLAVTTQMKSVL